MVRRRRRLSGAVVAVLLTTTGLVAMWPPATQAASSIGCDGGGFAVTFGDGSTLRGDQTTTVPAARLGSRLLVRGRYVEFDVTAASFAVSDYTFTGAPNPLDMTGGRRIVAFASKVPDHRGLSLTSNVSLQLDKDGIAISRSGTGLRMTITAKDCANGGLFQMEPERGDNTTTRFTHTLGAAAFYFDNPNFRAREGDVVPYKDTTIVVPSRINFATDLSPKFVGRDSPQVATRVLQGCINQIARRDGTFATVDHCGGVSVWDVASGGRMGAVFGEDATEVAPPATACTKQCQAQNQVRGQAVVLGFPFPVPQASRLQPRFP
jgi:hypothetical protein